MKKYLPGDLETAIMMAWQTSEDIDLLFAHYLDAPKPMTEDEVGNALLGIKILHDMRMHALMEMHCKVFELNEYCTDPVKLAARETLFGKVVPDVDVKINVNKPKKKKESK
jgi:hypothetical protein